MPKAQRAVGVIVAGLAILALQTSRASEPVRELERAPNVHKSAAVRALRDGEAIELNQASARDLTLLPGVGPKLAQRIVDERVRRGGFHRLEELLEVRGIGPATLARLTPLLSLDATGRTAALPSR